MQAGGVALLTDTKNEQVASWYESYGAVLLPDTHCLCCYRLKDSSSRCNAFPNAFTLSSTFIYQFFILFNLKP